METQSRTRSLSRLAGKSGIALAILLSSWQTGLAEDVFWTKRPGSNLRISGNASGALSAIGTDPVGADYSLYQFTGSDWNKISGGGRRIAVAPNGDLWVANDAHYIFRYTTASGWQILPGLVTEVAVGGDGSVWASGIALTGGGYQLFQWDGSNWVLNSGGATSIAVARDGTLWVVNDAGQIYWYNRQTSVWNLMPGQARSVHAGASSGSIWITGTQPIAGGYPVSKWNPITNSWDPYGTFGAVGITEVGGTPWIVQADGSVYSKQDSFPIVTIITVSDYVMPPMQPASLRMNVGSNTSGTMLCSAADSGSYYYCGDTKADYVGAYTLNLKCDQGFYDPIYGGTCWKCPDDDGNGAWIRSADPVDKPTACWRVPKETLTSAVKVKSPSWAWDCPGGSFWDGFSPDGIGGSCWQCPDDHPRRTSYAVWSNQACASPLNETNPATMLNFNGCPKPDAASMNLPGKRMPGKPFLDIAAGWSQGVISGGCYTCPVTDEAGNFLVSARNYKPIYDKDNNTGCRINLKWKPPAFAEPGLSGLAGVKEIIWENRLFEKEHITAALYDQADVQKLTGPAATAWVSSQWKALASSPYNSQAFRLRIFALLRGALAKDAAQRTSAEQMLISSLQSYIRDYKTYVATQGLGMYDAWKAYSDAARQSTAQGSSLDALFFYGPVPLDFTTTLSTLMATGGTGAGLLGAMAAAAAFNQLTSSAREDTLFQLFDTMKILRTAAGLSALAGATVIDVAFAILGTIAVNQFTDIISARPNLEASLIQAQQPVSLDELLKGPNGADQLYYFWGKAMDTSDTDDQQLLSVAGGAYASAQQKGFVRPQ
jgi:hypothetical protein